MAKVQYEPDSSGLEAIGKSSEMRAYMESTTSRIAQIAKGAAPTQTGLFKSSLEASVELQPEGRFGEMRYVGVVSTPVEYGRYVGGPAPNNFLWSIPALVEGGA